MRAAWVAFEGGEAAGKSTQARLLARRLDAVLTREPGGTAIGERLRAVVLDPDVHVLDVRAEALMMAADRAQHVAEVVGPALAGGRAVVSDRSAFSSLAYQGYGRGLPVDEIRSLCDWATGGVWPDLVLLLDVPVAVQAERMAREHDRMEAAGVDFHARVHAGFAALAAADPMRWRVVDGQGTIDAVAARVIAVVDEWEAGRA